jgi:hypothetical protein
MNYDYVETPLYKSVMAGLAVGIVATCANLLYGFIYKDVTQFSPSFAVINVTTVIFGTILLSMVGGLLYYFLVVYSKKQAKIFVGIFVALMALAVLLALFDNTFHLSQKFIGLYIGMLIITGLFIAFLIPWFASHKNFFFN